MTKEDIQTNIEILRNIPPRAEVRIGQWQLRCCMVRTAVDYCPCNLCAFGATYKGGARYCPFFHACAAHLRHDNISVYFKKITHNDATK